MPFTPTAFPGLMIFEPVVHGDDRGYFYESYNAMVFEREGLHYKFVQDNQARSVYGVVRGLHFQNNPHAQTKLIRVLEGEILDVVLDCRVGSPTYGQVYAIELSAGNRKQLLIPAGFAHGYSVLSPTAEVLYKCDAFYNASCESGVAFNDPTLKIDWKVPADKMIVSAKDRMQPLFADIKANFTFQP